MPARAVLRLEPPPGRDGDATFLDEIVHALGDEEDRIAAAQDSARRGFVGPDRVTTQNPLARPVGDEPRRNPSPRVAGRSKWKRIEALARLAEFGHAYRQALARWKAGMRDAVFPSGTWHMRVQHGACCATG